MTTADAVGPLPPPELARYIVGLGQLSDDEALTNYADQGAQLREIVLAELGDPADWGPALDFGCGSGRLLRQFAVQARLGQLVGCDIDGACVDWVNANLAGVEAVKTGVEPPLPFTDATFDVVWSTSVFSHLTTTWPDWLLELRRVVRPHGRLLISLMGEASSQPLAREPWNPDRIGMTVLGPGRPWPAGGPMVLHSEWWIRAHWGRAFKIIKFQSGEVMGQDLVLLERPDSDPPTREELLAPEPGEPREILALQHGLDLAHRENVELNAQHDRYATAYQDESVKAQALRVQLAEAQAEIARLKHAAGWRPLSRLRRHR